MSDVNKPRNEIDESLEEETRNLKASKSQDKKEVSELEIDVFQKSLAEIKQLNINEYCKKSIDELECDRNALTCALKKTKAKLSQSWECKGYRWDVEYREKWLEFLKKSLATIVGELGKIDTTISTKLEEAQRMHVESEEKYSKMKPRGWYNVEEKQKSLKQLDGEE